MHDCRDKQNHAALQFMTDDLGLLGGVLFINRTNASENMHPADLSVVSRIV